MKILITGITGFVGSHLADLLLSDCQYIYGLVRHRSNLQFIEGKNINLIEGDITDSNSVDKAIQEVMPDKVFHLAAQSFVPYSWQAPKHTFEVNVLGTMNLLESLRKYKKDAKILLTGTSEEYGLVEEKDLPITEGTPLRPLSPYGVSKVAMDMMGYQYYKNYGMHIVRTRAFNHEGARRGKEFVISQFIQQALDLKEGKIDKILVGNLGAVRDFSSVHDIINAYILVMDRCKSGEVYNICSGKGVRMQDILKEILDIVFNGEDVWNKVEVDTSRYRVSDVPVLIGDCSKFKNETGWYLSYSLECILKEMVQFYSSRR